MPRIQYIEKNFRKSSLVIIKHANEIIADYMAQGYRLTLRQLYYQFVSRDLIPNKQSEYKKLGSIVSDGRLAGLIDWMALEDRTRNLESLGHWSNPAALIADDASYYHEDKWKDQDNRVEVWIEKDALAGVFERVCQELDVPYLSCRGYNSQSEMWVAAMRLKKYERAGQQTVILHFGDHDPSGIDMTRDITDRLRLFGSNVDVIRVALNMPQVEEHNPPPNPAKEIDPRFQDYERKFGNESWELDALDPTVLSNLVREHVTQYQDADRWQEAVEHEDASRQTLIDISERWEEVEELING